METLKEVEGIVLDRLHPNLTVKLRLGLYDIKEFMAQDLDWEIVYTIFASNEGISPQLALQLTSRNIANLNTIHRVFLSYNRVNKEDLFKNYTSKHGISIDIPNYMFLIGLIDSLTDTINEIAKKQVEQH